MQILFTGLQVGTSWDNLLKNQNTSALIISFILVNCLIIHWQCKDKLDVALLVTIRVLKGQPLASKWLDSH